jgi:hypothetical protein
MRHQIRTMLHQLAENGQLGTPARKPQADRDDDDALEHSQHALQAKGASNLRKAQAQAAQRQG